MCCTQGNLLEIVLFVTEKQPTSIAIGGANQFPGGSFTPVESGFFAAHFFENHAIHTKSPRLEGTEPPRY
jgi:hypothetical protein